MMWTFLLLAGASAAPLDDCIGAALESTEKSFDVVGTANLSSVNVAKGESVSLGEGRAAIGIGGKKLIVARVSSDYAACVVGRCQTIAKLPRAHRITAVKAIKCEAISAERARAVDPESNRVGESNQQDQRPKVDAGNNDSTAVRWTRQAAPESRIEDGNGRPVCRCRLRMNPSVEEPRVGYYEGNACQVGYGAYGSGKLKPDQCRGNIEYLEYTGPSPVWVAAADAASFYNINATLASREDNARLYWICKGADGRAGTSMAGAPCATYGGETPSQSLLVPGR